MQAFDSARCAAFVSAALPGGFLTSLYYWSTGISRVPLTDGSGALSDPRDRCRRPLAWEQIHQQHFPAVAPDDVGSDDLLRAVVGSLYQDVRADRLDQRKRRLLGEENHEIHRGERRHDRGPRRFGLYRPLRPLEAPDRMVGVERHDEPVARRAGLGQQMDMARMDQIEAAVAEPDPETAPTPLGDTQQRPLGIHDLFVAGDYIAASQLLGQITAADHGGSGPRDGNPGCDVGETGRFHEIPVARECRSQCRDKGVAGARYVGDLLHPRR